MIKKNTKLIFADTNRTEEIPGGMPFAKGDIINFPDRQYEVIEKQIDYLVDGHDQIINITYTLHLVSNI